MHRRKLVVIFFFFCLPLAWAQESQVKVSLSPASSVLSPIVRVKWYSNGLVYPEGVHVYRRAEGSLTWEKLTSAPIRRKPALDPGVIAADPDLLDFANIITTGTGQELQDEMILFNLIVKSFQSNAFADFLGIYFEDATPANGIAYEYRVNRVSQGRELLLGVSPPILATRYAPENAIDSVSVFQNEKAIALNWHHDEDRYYGINIYRRKSSDSAYTKLNANPVVLSLVPDSSGNLGYASPMFQEARGLDENSYYEYQLAGVGFFEEETARSKPVRVYFKDTTPPLAPEDMTGKADSMKVHLRWKTRHVPDLEGVWIYRSSRSEGPFEKLNKQPLDSLVREWRDSLTIPGPYYYFTAAVDYSGNEAHSNMVFVEVQDVIPPAPPQDVTIATDTGKIVLQWRMGNESDLAGYYIYRTIDRNDPRKFVFLNAEPIRENKFEQKIPANVRNKFFYYVLAVDTSFNRSKASEFVSGRMPDILPPEKPFIQQVAYEEGQNVVHWVRNVDEDLMGYHLYRADTTRQFSRVNVNMLGRETFRFIDRDAMPNTEYYYYLLAYDSAGNASIPSKEIYAKRIESAAAASGSIDLRIKENKRKKKSQLYWTYKSTQPTRGYVVFAGPSEELLRPVSGLIQGTTFSDSGSRFVDAECYQVRAYSGEDVIYSPIIKRKL